MFKKDFKKEKNRACPAKLQRSRGVAVLFAVLVAVILVSVGATIVSIALRQTVLSSTGRDSQVAFYVANTALECARYWDFNWIEDAVDGNKYVFPASGIVPSQDPAAGGDYEDEITCDGFNIINGTDSNWSQSGGDTSFQIFVDNSKTGEVYCGSVEVTKTYDPAESKTTTTIQTRGYNVDSCSPTSVRAVERGLEISYES